MKLEVEAFSDEIHDIVAADAELETVAEGFEKTEGPVWLRDERALLFTDFQAQKIYRWSEADGLSVYREESSRAVGMALDASGRLVACEGITRRVTRTEPDGGIATVASHFDGKRLNSPNDVAVRSDGNVYFTDPRSRYLTDTQELDFNGVFRVAAETPRVSLVASDFTWPNGICFSPDEARLYVNDSRTRQIRVFEVAKDGSTDEGRPFAELDPTFGKGAPDGMKTDASGRVYVTGPGGVWVLGSDGGRIGILRTPIGVLNVGFGGPDGDELYMTAQTTLYRLSLLTHG